jgi:cytochrome c-type biogenesis protein CcmH/NrfG
MDDRLGRIVFLHNIVQYFVIPFTSSLLCTMWNQLRMSYQSIERLYNQLSPDLQTPVKSVVIALSLALMNFLFQEVKRNSSWLFPSLQNHWGHIVCETFWALRIFHYLQENNVLMFD